MLGDRPGTHDAADIRGDYDQVRVFLPPDVGEQHRRCVDVVDGNIEEPLDLVGMQVNGQHPVGADTRDHVRHDTRADRHAGRARAAILARITEIGQHRRDAIRGGAAYRVDHQQQLHEVVIGRLTGRLHDEDVLAADVFHDVHLDLAVAEAPDMGLAEPDAESRGDILREARMSVAGEYHHAGIQTREAVVVRKIHSGYLLLCTSPTC